jgi:hypothetical protein
MDKALRWLRGIFRPSLTVLDIYGLERVTQRFLIAHGDELVDNFYAESALMRSFKSLPGGIYIQSPITYEAPHA